MSVTINHEADRLGLLIALGMSDCATEDDPVVLEEAVDQLSTGNVPHGEVVVALARRYLAALRLAHGEDGAWRILRAQVAATHLGDVGGL
ncbi:hypothetical protein R4172_11055 [Rhodococcus kroppenstedtii]|uniref:hypothetical protein n=1 Tax=Rhodococcoides kroppenstedtii TaxID=293050 RepID=UPI002954BD6D|nr:hypothetical protein [Rhodococcus kroppenstedtii]MDV7198102.1 hypothetical protein [Rhodococcus kroppenstedtii]